MRILMWEHFAPGGPIRVGGHHLAERFLRRGARIAWCTGPVSPANFVKAGRETRARLRLWRRGGEFLRDGALFAYAPMTLAPYRPYPLLDRAAAARLTLRATVPAFRKVLAGAGFERVDLLWMNPGSPFLALLDEVPHDLSVYRMSDDTAAFPKTPASFSALEAEVCRRADLVVATARRLLARARSLGARHAIYLPNACDPEPFQQPGLAEPADLAALPRPRAAYVGAIDSWFDAPLLGEVARRLAGWSFVLLGPARADLARLGRLPNVFLLGPRPYGDLPAYLAHVDVGIVPFRLDALTHAIHPIKVYEYCAAGIPVVATPMEETAAMGAPLRLADGPGDFAAALEQARAEDGAGRAARLAFARRHTWDRRFEQLMAVIGPLRGTAAAVPAAGSAPQRRARVLHVISTLLPGGTEMAALRLVQRLDPARYDFQVAYLKGEPALAREFETAGARVVGMRLRGKADPLCLVRLWRHVRRERIDLVHTHMDLADYYGAFAARLGGARGLISSKHNADEFRTRRTWKRYPFLALERLAYEAADAVIVVSAGLVEFLREAEHLPTRKMVVIVNGVDGRIAGAAPPRDEARRRLGLPPFDPLVGTVGRLAPQKGQIDLLRALPAILAAFPSAGVVLAGEGPSRGDLESEARRLGIADRVVFLGHRRDVPVVLAALDLFALPSLWEGLPQALLEAMALSLPVVAARATGVADVVSDGETGLLVPARHPAALAGAAISLLRDPVLARRLGASGRRAVLEKHSLAAMASQIDRLYRRVLGEGP
ncbi:MAG: glycosyltransferase [Acidobacteria bacterium]|nr:glycosyltransferase [Acidobacteriota bacterium]